jgi:hypothetical protein
MSLLLTHDEEVAGAHQRRIMYNMTKMQAIPTYESADGTVIQFRCIDDMPGFSHRVTVDGVAKDWLSNECKPSAKVAEYFYGKHAEKAPSDEG